MSVKAAQSPPVGRTEKELVILAADKDIEYTLKGLLSRTDALGIREMTYDILLHPRRDPGCRGEGVDFLRIHSRRYDHALIVFDWEGSGGTSSPEVVESEMERKLQESGWVRNAVIILQPELEQWAWSRSPHLDDILGWGGRTPLLRDWMMEQGFFTKQHDIKPQRPKEAFDLALRHVRKARSASLFKELAQKISFSECQDPSFNKFKRTLSGWFPAGKSPQIDTLPPPLDATTRSP